MWQCQGEMSQGEAGRRGCGTGPACCPPSPSPGRPWFIQQFIECLLHVKRCSGHQQHSPEQDRWRTCSQGAYILLRETKSDKQVNSVLEQQEVQKNGRLDGVTEQQLQGGSRETAEKAHPG